MHITSELERLKQEQCEILWVSQKVNFLMIAQCSFHGYEGDDSYRSLSNT